MIAWINIYWTTWYRCSSTTSYIVIERQLKIFILNATLLSVYFPFLLLIIPSIIYILIHLCKMLKNGGFNIWIVFLLIYSWVTRSVFWSHQDTDVECTHNIFVCSPHLFSARLYLFASQTITHNLQTNFIAFFFDRPSSISP